MKALALAWSPSKLTGSLPLSFILLLQLSGSLPRPTPRSGSPPPLPPPPLLPPGKLKGNPDPPNHLGSVASPGGHPPFQTEDVSSSLEKVCVGSVVVCVTITVVMVGSLEVAVWLLGLEWVGMDSANFSSCCSLFSSSLEGILMSMLSGWPSLLTSSTLLWSESSLLVGPHSLWPVTLESSMSRLYSLVGSLWDAQQLLWLLYLTMYQKQCVKSNYMGIHWPLWYTKYPVLSPSVTYNMALRYFLKTLHSLRLLSGKPALNTASALDAIMRFNLVSWDNGLWLDLTWVFWNSWHGVWYHSVCLDRLRLASLRCSFSLVQTTAHCVFLLWWLTYYS